VSTGAAFATPARAVKTATASAVPANAFAAAAFTRLVTLVFTVTSTKSWSVDVTITQSTVCV
jgi:hypothetical protein